MNIIDTTIKEVTTDREAIREHLVMSDTTLATYVALGSIGTAATILIGMNLSLARAGWTMPQRRAVVVATAAILVAWLGTTATLAWLGAYHGGPGRFPLLPVATVAPVLVGALLIRHSNAVWRVVEAVPQQWLVGVQLWRVIGAVFVVLWAGGSLPGAFALPAGLGDLATGLLAPVAALVWVRSRASGAAAVRWWNLLGMADLLVAFVTGVATTPRLAPLLGIDLPNTLIDRFPLVLIPAFAVPLAAVLHLASLAKLRHADVRTASATDRRVIA
jgi:hypothetical protein